MNTYDKQAAYRAVMARIRETVELPPNRAPQSWLAEQLKVSRQLAYVWAEAGIPESHAHTIADMLKMDPIQVCPSLAKFLPEDVFHAIVQSKKRKSFYTRMVEALRSGLSASDGPLKTKEDSPKIEEKLRVSAPAQMPMKAVGGFIPISAEELETQREEAIKAGADLSIKGRSK